MTREEAIELLRDTPIDIRSTREDDIHTLYATAQMMAIDALRPVSREQVERGEWVGVPSMGVYDTACSKCGYCPGIRFWSSDFCPNCGAPMTDEAVQMVMERMEKLHEDNGCS